MNMKSQTRISLMVIAGIMLSIVLWYQYTMIQAKIRMEWFLKQKYGKEFVVEGVHYRYPYLGAALEITGMAHPKDDLNLKFDITRSASDNDPKTKFYGETYFGDLWEKQKREQIGVLLNSDLVWTDISAYYKEKEIYGQTINIGQVEQLFKGRIDLYISYGMFLDYKKYNKHYNEFQNFFKGDLTTNQAENLYCTIKKLQNSNYKEIDLEITYFNGRYQKEVKKDPRTYFTGKVSDFEELSTYKKGTILCRFCINDINNVHSVKDVGKFINLKAGYLHQDKFKE